MSNLYISDLHLGHHNVLRFDNRPFETIEQMDEALIYLWNKKVTKTDDVWIVGDFSYRAEKDPSWYLEQLKGRKHLIIGNHDKAILKSEKALSYFETVDKMQFITDNGEKVILCHFPMAEWNGFHRGSYHVYGHIHNRKNEAYEFMKTRDCALNAGCMINYFQPASLRELIANNKTFQESVYENGREEVYYELCKSIQL